MIQALERAVPCLPSGAEALHILTSPFLGKRLLVTRTPVGSSLQGQRAAGAGAAAAALALPTRKAPSAAPSAATSGEGREQRQRTIAIVFPDFLRADSSGALLLPRDAGRHTEAPLRLELFGHGPTQGICHPTRAASSARPPDTPRAAPVPICSPEPRAWSDTSRML